MKTMLAGLGWAALLAAIIGATLILLQYWTPRGTRPPVKPTPAPAPAAASAPAQPYTSAELRQIQREAVLASIRAEREQMQREALRRASMTRKQRERPSANERCFNGTRLLYRDGAWTNSGRC